MYYSFGKRHTGGSVRAWAAPDSSCRVPARKTLAGTADGSQLCSLPDTHRPGPGAG
jgi:hypothetical protein